MKIVMPFVMFILLTSGLTIAHETTGFSIFSEASAVEVDPQTQAQAITRDKFTRQQPQPAYYENGRPVYVNFSKKKKPCKEPQVRDLKTGKCVMPKN